jgi:hypothetical protein
MWSCRWAKKTQGNTSTTLVTKASSVIVQRQECAGSNLDRARGASLDTKESHNTPPESKQKHKEQVNATDATENSTSSNKEVVVKAQKGQ